MSLFTFMNFQFCHNEFCPMNQTNGAWFRSFSVWNICERMAERTNLVGDSNYVRSQKSGCRYAMMWASQERTQSLNMESFKMILSMLFFLFRFLSPGTMKHTTHFIGRPRWQKRKHTEKLTKWLLIIEQMQAN